MSLLSPDFIDELRARTSIVQIVGRKVAWDLRKSQQAKGDMWAPCPFHQEKTASFHVDDRKGVYYCFGCQSKGNVFSFLMEAENISFIEAVRKLAHEAGMELPARDPKEEEKASKHKVLREVMERAVQYFRLQLKRAEGARARDHLKGRGLSQATIDRFDIGFAPDASGALFSYLREKGIGESDILEAGLAIKPDDGRAIYDRFRGRIIFPIRDSQSRAIALGGRAMDPNAKAKYLNSPETPIFRKGQTLYNFSPARAALSDEQKLIVCEGYMDVIALSQAGFTASVAPLGTAVSEAQFKLLWRCAQEPVFALDGDRAGLRAAYRLIEIALPLISADRRLQFCLLPEGLDPDDIVKSQGKRAMQALLSKSLPLIDLIWQRETRGKAFSTPEARAALQSRLRALSDQIQSSDLRRHYEAEIKNRLWVLFRPNKTRPAQRGARWSEPEALAVAATKNSILAGEIDLQAQVLDDSILAILLRYPALCEHFSDALAEHIFGAENAAIQAAILNFQGEPEELFDHLGEKHRQRVENLYARRHIRDLPVMRSQNHALARESLKEIFARIAAIRGARQEIHEGEIDIETASGEELTYRLKKAQDALGYNRHGEIDPSLSEGQTENELSRSLQEMIDRKIWVKEKA